MDMSFGWEDPTVKKNRQALGMVAPESPKAESGLIAPVANPDPVENVPATQTPNTGTVTSKDVVPLASSGIITPVTGTEPVQETNYTTYANDTTDKTAGGTSGTVTSPSSGVQEQSFTSYAPVADTKPLYTPSANETVAGNLTGLLDENGKYMQSARAAGAQEGATRGLLNSSMSAGASESAAIKAALPIAAQDAQYMQTRGLSYQDYLQKSGLSAQEANQTAGNYYVQGDVSSKLAGESAEYERILSAQNAGQALTAQEQQYKLDYENKSKLTAQAAEAEQLLAKQAAGYALTQLERDKVLTYQANSALASEKANYDRIQDQLRHNQTLTQQEQQFKLDYENKAKLAAQQAITDKELEDKRQAGATVRTNLELQSKEVIAKLDITSSEKKQASTSLEAIGTAYANQVAQIMQNPQWTAAMKQAMIDTATVTYRNSVNSAMLAYGVTINWTDGVQPQFNTTGIPTNQGGAG